MSELPSDWEPVRVPGTDHARPRVATILFPRKTEAMAPASGPPRLMVVDDNDGFRESLVALLVSAGIEVVGEASSGRQALEVAGDVRPDVVLMDVRMPNMDGVETTRQLKQAFPQTRVVALTAQEDDQTVREMLLAGASGYVTKTADGEDILDAVADAAAGGAVLSPSVTPAVITQLTEALESERRRAQELEEAHLALIEKVARRHELVARIGHELRTPVTVILGLSKTLSARDLPDAERRELLERLTQRASGLAKLVERFEGALDAAVAEPTEVVELIRRIGRERPQVRLEVPDRLPLGTANRTLAARILEELVANACTFSDPDQPVLVAVESDQEHIAVRVIDHGPGVAEADRQRIFDPLEQAEALDARTHQGAGVGLSLARAAARAMDGDLVLEDSGPDGSTFLWTLPAVPH
jgi:signal transduction histidine kinase